MTDATTMFRQATEVVKDEIALKAAAWAILTHACFPQEDNLVEAVAWALEAFGLSQDFPAKVVAQMAKDAKIERDWTQIEA